MSRLLFVLLIVVVASATLAVNIYADKDEKEIEDKGTGYYRCTIEGDPGIYYYNEKVFDTCKELKVKN